MFGLFSRNDKELGNRGEELPIINDGYPDTYTLSGLCSRCNNQSSFESIISTPISFSGTNVVMNNEKSRSHIDQVSVLECRHCKQRIVVIEEEWIGEKARRLGGNSGFTSFRGVFWWPLSESKLSDDVPILISDVYSEGDKALAANCPRAAVVMFRRTLESITYDKGIEKGSLFKRIEKLCESNIISPTFKDWFSEIRHVGNDGAHFDPVNKVEVEDAKAMKKFIREIIRHLYEIPSELERRRKD